MLGPGTAGPHPSRGSVPWAVAGQTLTTTNSGSPRNEGQRALRSVPESWLLFNEPRIS